jgi:hypothetical protein
MAASVTKTLLTPSGISSFRRFLEAQRHVLMQSPILVIASEPAESQPHLSMVSESCQLVQFTLAQQMGFRTVPSTISSAFPTMQDLEQRCELIRRTGASSVVAVGSGAAMDLAKALPYLGGEKGLEHIILVPSTYAAVLASGSSHSLFLDSVEETLVPIPKDDETTTTTNCTTTIAPLDSKYIAPVDSSHVLYASLALILDACYRKSDNPHLPGLLQKVSDLLDDDSSNDENEKLSHDKAMELLYESGRLVSYGLGREDRSTPIALAASLIPQLFPHVHVLTFLASLLPGLCHHCSTTTSDDDGIRTLVERIRIRSSADIPQLTVADETLEGFSIPDMALSHIRSNQTVWKSFDVPDSTLTEILQYSLKR